MAANTGITLSDTYKVATILVKSLVGPSINQLAGSLGVPQHALANIHKQDNINGNSCFFVIQSVLDEWIKSKTSATFADLVTALKDTGLNMAAHKIGEHSKQVERTERSKILN